MKLIVCYTRVTIVILINIVFVAEGQNLILDGNDYPLSKTAEADDTKCPNATEILPCTCDSGQSPPNIDCSLATDEMQLYSIFSTVYFPVINLGEFKIRDNSVLTALTFNFFGNITFDTFVLYGSIINNIDATVFENFNDSMTKILITLCNKLSVDTVPFEKFSDLKILDTLDLQKNSFDAIPMFLSSSLEYLYLNVNYITTIFSNTLHEQFEKLHFIYLGDNKIEEIPSLAFIFQFEPEVDVHVYLESNNIHTIHPDSFQGLYNYYIDLHDNNLTTLDEDVFRPILTNNTFVDIYENPIVCDCNIAWVVNNANLFQYISYHATCEDGTTYLADLDLSYCD